MPTHIIYLTWHHNHIRVRSRLAGDELNAAITKHLGHTMWAFVDPTETVTL